jgi:4,5-DOPA dioxygenase extradiol
MPVLFLGHGSPMNAIEENEFVQGFRAIVKTIPYPRAIICVSAHWYTKGTFVTAMEKPKTIHDFGGFPKALFDVQYPAKGSPELATSIQQTILSISVGLDQHWGLDHGAWSVLKHLYPKADIPVVQLSIDYSLSPQQHFDLAKQLASLRSKGILIVGSGNIVHNLGLVDFSKINEIGYGFDWAKEVREKVNKALVDSDYKSLIQYEKMGKAMQLAVPTPDHYLPLLYTLGLQMPNETIELFNDQLLAGSLSMTSVKIG